MKIGTRGSKLALIQTQKLINELQLKNPSIDIEIVVIQTSGDWKPSHGEKLLSEVEGGKGLFAKEIEMALIEGRIDVGVHSFKDVPTFLPKGLKVYHVLEREDPRDAFISFKANSIDELPEGAVVGTSSMRRKSILLSRRPDLQIVPLRGNVDTRLQKLRDGQVDATILAAAGLTRMGLTSEIASYIEPEAMLPAVCQGIIAMEIRENDAAISEILDTVHHVRTGKIALAERGMLTVLDGSCRTPIGSYGQWMENNVMRLRGLVASPDGLQIYQVEETAKIMNDNDAYAFGLRVGTALKAKTPQKYLQVHG
jgi:hydroxymethylbilane synthase